MEGSSFVISSLVGGSVAEIIVEVVSNISSVDIAGVLTLSLDVVISCRVIVAGVDVSTETSLVVDDITSPTVVTILCMGEVVGRGSVILNCTLHDR